MIILIILQYIYLFKLWRIINTVVHKQLKHNGDFCRIGDVDFYKYPHGSMLYTKDIYLKCTLRPLETTLFFFFKWACLYTRTECDVINTSHIGEIRIWFINIKMIDSFNFIGQTVLHIIYIRNINVIFATSSRLAKKWFKNLFSPHFSLKWCDEL